MVDRFSEVRQDAPGAPLPAGRIEGFLIPSIKIRDRR